jgi:hypothetical protein
MTARPPVRHWQRHGTGPLPSCAEAMDEPFAAFPRSCATTAAAG